MDWNSTFDSPAKKMIIMTSRLLSDAHRYILRCLDTHQTIVHCTIFTSISEVHPNSFSCFVDCFEIWCQLASLFGKNPASSVDIKLLNFIFSSQTTQVDYEIQIKGI